MNYAQIAETLVDHPKVTLVMRRLKVNRFQIVGHLATLWNWALKNAPDGDLSRFTHRNIADAARWTDIDSFEDEEDVRAGIFVRALIDCTTHELGHGFIEDDHDGIRLHDWDEFGGKLDERRNRSAYLAWLRRYQDRNPGVQYRDSPANFEQWQHKLPPIAEETTALRTSPPPANSPQTTLPLHSHDVATMSSRHNHDVAYLKERRGAERSGEDLSLDKRSSSVEEVQEETHGPPVKAEHATATAPMDKFKDIPDERMPLPDEPPGVYVRRVLPLCPPTWRKLVESRWKALYEAGKGGSEWGFKAKILRDLVTGAEPPPGESTEPPLPPPRLVRSAIPVPPDWLPGVDTGTAHGLARNAHLRLKQTIPDIQPLDDRVRDEARRLYEESKKVAETPKSATLREAEGPKSFSNIAARVLPNRKIGPDYSPGVEEAA